MPLSVLFFYLLLVIVMLASYLAGKLTLPATICGGSIAAAIYLGSGFTGVAMLGAFFGLSVWATSWYKDQKNSEGSRHPQKRDAWQVLANGGIAGIIGLFSYLSPSYEGLGGILLASAFSSATADTLSSELGVVYGRRFYNIISFKTDVKGSNGVVSVEGSLAGLAGSVVIALIYSIGFGWGVNILLVVLAGTAGNMADSVMGATLERKGYLGNNSVNFLNTVFACFVTWLLLFI